MNRPDDGFRQVIRRRLACILPPRHAVRKRNLRLRLRVLIVAARTLMLAGLGQPSLKVS